MDDIDSTRTEGMRPLRIGEMLSRIWDLLRRDILLYLKIAAVPTVALSLMYAAMLWPMHRAGLLPATTHGAPPGPRSALIFLAAVLLLLPPAFAIYAIFEGAVCSSVLAAMRGERSTFVSEYREAMRRSASLLWIMSLRTTAAILPWIIVIVAVAGAGALGAMRRDIHAGALFVLVPLLALAYISGTAWAIWITLHLSLGMPACMAEGLTGWQALKRSGELSRGGKWRIFGVMFLVYLLGMAAVIALEMLIFGAVGVGALALSLMHVPFNHAAAVTGEIPLFLVLIAALYVVVALQYAGIFAALTVLYQDQRFRHEGALALPPGS